MLRSLAYPIACALTGAASGLLVAQLATPPAPTCPKEPVLELRQVATALAEAHAAPPPPPPPAPEPARCSAAVSIPDDAVRCKSEGNCVVSRNYLDELFSNPGQVWRQARVMPSIQDGVPTGFKFYGIRPDSLPRRLGMKNGDLLTTINGAEVRTIEQVMDRIVALRHARTVDLDIVRKGEPVRLHVEIE